MFSKSAFLTNHKNYSSRSIFFIFEFGSFNIIVVLNLGEPIGKMSAPLLKDFEVWTDCKSYSPRVKASTFYEPAFDNLEL